MRLSNPPSPTLGITLRGWGTTPTLDSAIAVLSRCSQRGASAGHARQPIANGMQVYKKVGLDESSISTIIEHFDFGFGQAFPNLLEQMLLLGLLYLGEDLGR